MSNSPPTDGLLKISGGRSFTNDYTEVAMNTFGSCECSSDLGTRIPSKDGAFVANLVEYLVHSAE